MRNVKQQWKSVKRGNRIGTVARMRSDEGRVVGWTPFIRLRSSVYVLFAISIVGALGTALGFAFVSAMRHLVWSYTMGSTMTHIPLLLETGALAAITLVFWYRIIAAGVRQWFLRKEFRNEIAPHLQELKAILPQRIRSAARWYVLEDSQYLAFTWGVVRPRIVLSRGLLDALNQDALRAVMYHEATHAWVYDPLQELLLLILSDALGQFGMRAIYHRYLIHREILADREAVAAFEGDDAPLLAALLVAAGGNGHQHTAGWYAGLVGVMEARVQFLETGHFPRPSSENMRYRLLATTMAILLTVAQGVLIWCH